MNNVPFILIFVYGLAQALSTTTPTPSSSSITTRETTPGASSRPTIIALSSFSVVHGSNPSDQTFSHSSNTAFLVTFSSTQRQTRLSDSTTLLKTTYTSTPSNGLPSVSLNQTQTPVIQASLSSNPAFPLATDPSSSNFGVLISTSSTGDLSFSINPPIFKTITTIVSGLKTQVPVLIEPGESVPILLTPTTTIAPKGAQASSSKALIGHELVGIVPNIQGWIDTKGKQDVKPIVNGLNKIEDSIKSTLSEIEGDVDQAKGKSCTGSLFSLLSCAIHTVTGLTSKISGAIVITDDIINSVKAQLSDIKKITKELSKTDKTDEASSESQKTASTHSTTISHPSRSSTASSSRSSCTDISTAEDRLVTCSNSPVTKGNTATMTEICKTVTKVVSGCTVSASASTTTITSSTPVVQITQFYDFIGKTGVDHAAAIRSYQSADFACMSSFVLPLPTDCSLRSKPTTPKMSTIRSQSLHPTPPTPIFSPTATLQTLKSRSHSTTHTTAKSATENASEILSELSALIGIFSTGLSTTKIMTTSASAATACTLTSKGEETIPASIFQGTTRIPETVLPATSYCACNNDIVAAIATRTGDDARITKICAVEGSVTFAIATETPRPTTLSTVSPTHTSSLPPPPAPPVASLRPHTNCHLHLRTGNPYYNVEVEGQGWNNTLRDSIWDGDGMKSAPGLAIAKGLQNCGAMYRGRWHFQTLGTDLARLGEWRWTTMMDLTTTWGCVESRLMDAGAPKGTVCDSHALDY